MRFYKIVDGNYITAVGTGSLGTEITESEYNEIITLIQTKPAHTETTDYRLKTDLTWEEFDLPVPDPDPEIDESETLEILLGGDAE